MPRFDGYTATTLAARPEEIFNLFWTIGDEVRTGRGFHRFETRHAAIDHAGDEVGAVYHGGTTHGKRVMVEVKGERTPAFVERFRQSVEDHRCTRVDSCEDFDAPGAWERLLGHVLDVKREFKLKGEKRGDWDFPEDGRTQYLGAEQSTVRARLYEKGKQPSYRHLERADWVRLEVQVRPVREAKTTYSRVDATDVWGASPFTRSLAGRVLEQIIGKQPAGTIYKLSQRDRALAWMCRQYGSHLVSLKGDLGDWQSVGLTLAEILQAQEERDRRKS